MPTKKQLEEADRLAKQIDWAKYDAMSDEEIRAHWAWDPDMAWPTDEELKEFKLVSGTELPPDREADDKGSVSSRDAAE